MTDAQKILADGIALVQRGQETEGYRLIVAAANADPTNAGALYHLGLGLQSAKSYGPAATAFLRALEHVPEIATQQEISFIELNAGYNLHLSGRTEDGLPLIESAMRRNPDWALTHLDVSQLYTTMDRMAEGLDAARRAVDLSPDEPRAMMSLAFALFLNDKWFEGFQAYEARFRFKIPELLTYPYPRWTGGAIDTLFIQAEQGLGDTLMMMRYLPKACSFAKRVILYVQKELKTLVESHVPRNVEVHGMPQPVPAGVDAFIPMMSLPLVLGVNFDRFKPPYISAPVNWDRDKEAAKTDGLHVGIVWSGDPSHDLDRWRSVPLEQLLPLFETQSVHWHSLQVGPAAADLGKGYYGLIKDEGPNISNYADTARIVAGLDLVISVDTSIAHLVGGMNKPIWLMVNQQGNDWRWTPPSPTTHWYPSMRLFRKPLNDADWRRVVSVVKVELEKKVEHREHLPFAATFEGE